MNELQRSEAIESKNQHSLIRLQYLLRLLFPCNEQSPRLFRRRSVKVDCTTSYVCSQEFADAVVYAARLPPAFNALNHSDFASCAITILSLCLLLLHSNPDRWLHLSLYEAGCHGRCVEFGSPPMRCRRRGTNLKRVRKGDHLMQGCHGPNDGMRGASDGLLSVSPSS